MTEQRLQFRIMFIDDIGVLGWNDIVPFEADVDMDLIDKFVLNTFVSPNIYMIRWNIKTHPDMVDQMGQGHYISLQKNIKPERFTGFFDYHGQPIFESDIVLDGEGYDYVVFMNTMGEAWAANDEQEWYIEEITFDVAQTLTVIESLNEKLFQVHN
jgi:hypothetical protein